MKKSEARNPKSERSTKSEARIETRPRRALPCFCARSSKGFESSIGEQAAAVDFRISGFGLLSDFGVRISDFAPVAPPIRNPFLEHPHERRQFLLHLLLGRGGQRFGDFLAQKFLVAPFHAMEGGVQRDRSHTQALRRL